MPYKICKIESLCTYKTGSIVEEDGFYVCVPCGYKKYLLKGMRFPACLECIDKKQVKEGLELWEKINSGFLAKLVSKVNSLIK